MAAGPVSGPQPGWPGRGRISLARSVSDILPLSEAPKAVDRLRRKEGNPIRLVLRP